ncbi:MAG TPA: hypothetical protein ENI13_01960 [candidate division CPR3 bacterium]|uniref:Uncharacterized protein n=1 Tax=candidate division CPR3 bacterium TaxID=2268181 RepID=A0A7C1NSR2_UNCC3|nr:hypothetical protein [candidate division CPR3 bacterium]
MDKKEYEKRKYLSSRQAKVDVIQPSESKFKLHYPDQYRKMEDRVEAGEKKEKYDKVQKDEFIRQSRNKGEAMRILNAEEKFDHKLNG